MRIQFLIERSPKNKIAPALLAAVSVVGLVATPGRAWALQPLEAFRASARANALDGQEARWVAAQRKLEAEQAWARL